MPKIANLALALAAAALAIPAMAGNSWPQGPGNKAKVTAPSPAQAAVAVKASAKAAPMAAGFTYSGEGAGWEPSQHKYVLTTSGLQHSDECDHAMRTASAMTIKDVEAARKQYPGG